MPYALAAMAGLVDAGFELAITTNQARALSLGASAEELADIHRHGVKGWIAACGIPIAAHMIWYDGEGGILGAKPNLIGSVENRIGPIDRPRSWVVEPVRHSTFDPEGCRVLLVGDKSILQGLFQAANYILDREDEAV